MALHAILSDFAIQNGLQFHGVQNGKARFSCLKHRHFYPNGKPSLGGDHMCAFDMDKFDAGFAKLKASIETFCDDCAEAHERNKAELRSGG